MVVREELVRKREKRLLLAAIGLPSRFVKNFYLDYTQITLKCTYKHADLKKILRAYQTHKQNYYGAKQYTNHSKRH